MSDATNIGIACQGGGSHTAFTAGVLKRLLDEYDWGEEYDLVGISGTSGGAFNALAAWYGLVTSGTDEAIDLLDSIWGGLSAKEFDDKLLNTWLTTANKMAADGFPFPEFSPYEVPGEEIGKERIRSVLEEHIDFEEIPPHCKRTAPELVVGTVNVNAGIFETFTNEDVTVDAILASAAIPDVFEAVKINGHYHWDGLFSQNPPVRDLMNQPPERKPEELWIVQINAQEHDGEPTTNREIVDRRNELSGNISLNQELRFIEQINEWVDDGKLPAGEFKQTDIHRIEMGERFHSSTKVDRDPEFIAELMELGTERANNFIADRAE
jgi:NTE family protein